MGSNRIGIVGLGLIGGSLGLDLQNLGHEVYGLVNRAETASRAKERGLAQFISTDPSIIADCSIIILALPLPQLLNPKQDIIDALPQHAIITDVGSVKTPVVEVWRKIHPRFIGSHPMAGTIHTGVEAGETNLFKGRPWVSTPDKNTDKNALQVIQGLATDLGSTWITTNPKLHDQAVALISHLPVFVSASLMQTVTAEPDETLVHLTEALASSGFADTTRVGCGNPSLGVAMASLNTSYLLEALQTYRLSIDKFEKLIRSKQWDKLQEELQKNQLSRAGFLEKKTLSS